MPSSELARFGGTWRGGLVAGRGVPCGGLCLDALGGLAGLAFFEIVRIVAGLNDDPVFLEGDDLIADAVEKIPVM